MRRADFARNSPVICLAGSATSGVKTPADRALFGTAKAVP
jgi:hypothetical protein